MMENSNASIALNLRDLQERVRKAYESVPNNPNKYPTLVAVGKLKPKELIIEAYRCGQRHFGENYIQELHEKSNDPEVIEQCPEIKWHMIGHVQTNKINKLLDVPNLYCIQTVDSTKFAETLNSAINRHSFQGKINVLVQINTSGEKEKSGIDATMARDLVKFIQEKCDRLELLGLMTIGAYDFDTTKGLNPDFLKLVEVRKQVQDLFQKPEIEIEISMGMTADFEQAIMLGSTIVRVGTAIFGQRPKKN